MPVPKRIGNLRAAYPRVCYRVLEMSPNQTPMRAQHSAAHSKPGNYLPCRRPVSFDGRPRLAHTARLPGVVGVEESGSLVPPDVVVVVIELPEADLRRLFGR